MNKKAVIVFVHDHFIAVAAPLYLTSVSVNTDASISVKGDSLIGNDAEHSFVWTEYTENTLVEIERVQWDEQSDVLFGANEN